MNKKQLVIMWVGILWFCLTWNGDEIFDYDTYTPIIVVITIGLIISFGDKNYKLIQELIGKLFKKTKKKDSES